MLVHLRRMVVARMIVGMKKLLAKVVRELLKKPRGQGLRKRGRGNIMIKVRLSLNRSEST